MEVGLAVYWWESISAIAICTLQGLKKKLIVLTWVLPVNDTRGIRVSLASNVLKCVEQTIFQKFF